LNSCNGELSSESEWLHAAQDTVAFDPNLGIGDWLLDSAPDCFTSFRGQAHVRFGRMMSLSGGADAHLPVPEGLRGGVIEAIENQGGAGITILPLAEGQSSEQAWAAFFETGLQEASALFSAMADSLSEEPVPSRLLTRVNQSGGIVAYAHVKEGRRIHNLQQGFEYIASLIDPSPTATTMATSRYDTVDPLRQAGVAGCDNVDDRQRLAGDLRNFLRPGGLYLTADPLEGSLAIEAVMHDALSFLTPHRVAARSL